MIAAELDVTEDQLPANLEPLLGRIERAVPAGVGKGHDTKGKVWLSDRAGALLNEIPAAYKDIDQVMADQADLVTDPAHHPQVLNYKGT